MHESILIGWKLVYWITFLLSWAVLPILIEFSQSGAFTTRQRLKFSIQFLARHYAVLLMGGVILFAYLIIVDHFTITGVIGLLMALGNTYGLLWIICLLGYGLVNIPRKIWSFADPRGRLRSVYFRAIQVHDERVESMFIYEDVVRDIKQLADRFRTIEDSTIVVNSELHYTKQCIQHVLDTMGTDLEAQNGAKSTRRSSRSALRTANHEDAMPTEKEIIHLHGRAKRIKADLRRCEQTWIDICYEASMLQSAIEITTDKPGVRTYLFKSAAVACIVGSAIIMWSELVMGGSEWASPLRSLMINGNSSFLTQFIVILVLLYMGICAYQSLFSMRMFGRLQLHGNHNSSELSLLTTSIHQSRLQFSLGYNFLLLLNYHEVTENTAFHALFTDMRLIHFFGTDFSMYAPVLMLVLAGLTFFHGYARLVRIMGLDQYEELIPGQVEHEAKISQGEALVMRGIEKYERTWAKDNKSGVSTLTAPLLQD
ncbi:hypothetical protein THRCLA_20519 [Thraustotheca clavata]|uniref:LMBR1 domain-containing protein 2 n=1 Tax=Thraustotheca clavata TaxID=74557 RepID=A0A1W0A6A7_9STRA|nr:hypothetical protein THRCLA_20519 [Thraustotheca clavata]